MRWVRLELRIGIALVLAVAGACWALTLTTTQWAAADYERQLEDRVSRGTWADLGRVSEALQVRPTAMTDTQLAAAVLDGAPSVDAEGLLIPVASSSTTVDLTLAHQYSFWQSSDATQRIPQCLQPQLTQNFDELQQGELRVWTEHCGQLVMGFGLVRPPDAGGRYAWMVVLALTPGVGMDPLIDPVPQLRESLVYNSYFIAAAAVVIAVILSAMVVGPLNKSRAMAEAVAAGDLGVRLPVHGRDAMGRMSAAVNTMADRLTGQISELEQANESQRRFVSDVAHELRTPTAALLASAEALEHPETRDEAAVLVAPQLRRLASLTEDLLEISRMDAGQAPVVRSRIDLMDLIAEVIAESGAPADVDVDGPAPVQISTDPARLRVVVRNLVANALQHGAPPVTITVEQKAGGVAISVHDCGTGVPAGLRERVFDRFVRGDAARHGPSSGLGLAIAAENARLLGGGLTLEEDGRTFRLVLPDWRMDQ